MSQPPSSSAPPPRRSPYRWPIRIGAVVLLAVCLYRFSSTPTPPTSSSSSFELRRFNIVPAFALTERSGRTITNADLLGKIWVADFIYTTCPGPCPLVTASMAKVQEATAHDPQVQLVTFTVDPQDDTPAVLAKYADQFGASPTRWWFLTGPEKPLYQLIQDGFYQAVQDNRDHALQPDEFTVTHSTKLVLVDTQGFVRGYYDGVGSAERADLLKGIKAIEQENN